MYVIDRSSASSATSKVIRIVQRAGVIRREQICLTTGLSPSTVSRAVQNLLDLEFLRERPDITPRGPKGRPSIPVQVDSSRHAVAGISIKEGSYRITISALNGRILTSLQLPIPKSSATDPPIDLMRNHVRQEIGSRTLVSLGIVADSAEDDGKIERLRTYFSRQAMPVRYSNVIHAGAIAEHLFGAQGRLGKTVYFHVEDSVGYVVVIEENQRTVFNDATDLTHFPTTSRQVCGCLKRGCLHAAAADSMLVSRSRELSLPSITRSADLYAPENLRDNPARELLLDRARIIGETAAVIRDMVRHSHFTFIGRAAVDPLVRESILQSLYSKSTLRPSDDVVSFGHLSGTLGSTASVAIALEQLFESPERIGHQARQIGRSA